MVRESQRGWPNSSRAEASQTHLIPAKPISCWPNSSRIASGEEYQKKSIDYLGYTKKNQLVFQDIPKKINSSSASLMTIRSNTFPIINPCTKKNQSISWILIYQKKSIDFLGSTKKNQSIIYVLPKKINRLFRQYQKNQSIIYVLPKKSIDYLGSTKKNQSIIYVLPKKPIDYLGSTKKTNRLFMYY